LIPFDAVRRRVVAVYAVLALLVAGGIFAIARAPNGIFPEVTFPLVRVIVNVGEEPAAQMMPTVTRPLEEAIRRVPGVTVVRSTTSRGSSEIDALFAWGSDMRFGLERVQAEAQRVSAQLPATTTLAVDWMNTATYPIEGYALTSDRETQAELWDRAVYAITPALLRIPGVARVQVQGGRHREFQVRLDPPALEGRHLTAGDVVDALRRDQQVRSAGLTERNHELYLVLVDGRVHDTDAIGAIEIPVAGGTPARLSELGAVTTADAVSYVRTSAGGREAVLLNVVRQPGANTVAVASAVDRLVRSHPDLIPPDARWSSFYDQARFVSDSIGGVRDAILVGVGLAALVLLVFLRRWRTAVVAVATLPLCVAIVGLALSVLHQTVNLMVLAGASAALGLIADDAIVVVESTDHFARASPDGAAARGIRAIGSALAGSSLSTIVVFLPFAFLSGVVGAFFRPLALTVAATLVVSFVLAWLVVPASLEVVGATRGRPPSRLGQRVSRTRAARLSRAVGRRLLVAYRRLVHALVRHGWIGVLATVGLVALAYVLHRAIGTDFLPAMDEGSIVMDYFTPPGTSLADTDAMMRQVDAVVLATPGVRGYSRRTGAQLGFFITEPNTGDYVIELEPRSQRRPIEDVIAALRARIGATEPAVHVDFGQLLEDEIGDLTGGTPQPVDVKIFGPRAAVLQEKARAAARIVSAVPGAVDVFDGVTVSGPALDVRIRPEAQGRYGLTTEGLHAAIEPAVVGTVAGQVLVGEKTYDLRVFVRGPERLRELLLRTPSSALVHVSDVATVSTGPPEVEIDRENLETYFGVTARLSGTNLGAAMRAVRGRIARELPLGSGMSIEYGGAYAQQQSSFRQLAYVLLIGVVLVAVVVLFEFGDWRAPLVTSFVSLATLSGVLVALVVTGQTLNVSSFVGAIMMVGIAGENAIFVLHEAHAALDAGAAPRSAWARASRRRLRPVVMTTLATSLALLPLALGIGQGSQLVQPLAIGIIGGFLVSAPAVLWLLPSASCALDRRSRAA